MSRFALKFCFDVDANCAEFGVDDGVAAISSKIKAFMVDKAGCVRNVVH